MRESAPGRAHAIVLVATLLCGLALAGCGGSSDSASRRHPDAGFQPERALADLRAQVAIGPRPAGSAADRREVRLITARLRRAGVRRITVQRPYRNVVARIPGRGAGVVVVGAHHDTKDIPGFVGANDGASGVALLLELARALPARLDGPSIDLVFFDAEESQPGESFAGAGDRGSSQFVRYARGRGEQGSPPGDRIRAMVLFDMVGDCDLHVPRESNSDPALFERFVRAASQITPSGSSQPFSGEASGVLDDHTPFIRAGIPAVDLIDFDYGPGASPGVYWHTRQDNLAHVCAGSLGAVGEPAVVALRRFR